MLVILPSLKTMELLQIEIATHFKVTPLISMRAVWLVLSLTLSVNKPSYSVKGLFTLTHTDTGDVEYSR